MSSELDRLRRENHILRTVVIVGVSVTLGVLGLGMSRSAELPKVVSIASDGTHLYRLYDNGKTDRLVIADREMRVIAEQNQQKQPGHRHREPSPGTWQTFTNR